MSSSEGSLRSFKHRNFRLFFIANMVFKYWNLGAANSARLVSRSDLHKNGSELGIVTGLQFLTDAPF